MPSTETASARPNPASTNSARPTIIFDPALPISAHVEQITDLVANNPVVIVAGQTGSGKTTQLPKMLLQAGRGRIAHTQPRRIAARSVAERIAEELQVDLGDLVGYQVRFTKKAGRQTALKVMTDGVLLSEITRDRDLRAYDTIIIDEAHERSLNIDFLLGYLKQLLTRRDDLLVVITSATIDTERFSKHFDDAPIVEVSGRTYPVEVRYRPLDGDDPDVGAGVQAAVKELLADQPGDILVFCSGEQEIRDCARAIESMQLANTEVLPLFARLSASEQHRIFAAHTGRRIVLATNIAETSLTVPGIRSVIDLGTARLSRYSARTKVQRLPIEPISRASAAQRAGRCGRTAPGTCIRLYSEEDFESRPEFTEPEILRTNLASVILSMAQARLGAIQSFPFVEAPAAGQITDGLRLLEELGAIRPGGKPAASNQADRPSVPDSQYKNDTRQGRNRRGRRGGGPRNDDGPQLTRIGHQLAQIPVDPRLGRMLIEAERRHCLPDVQVLVAALAIPDVRERPVEHRGEADALHARFHAPLGADLQPTTGTEQGDKAGPKPRKPAGDKGSDTQPPEPLEGGDLFALHRLWTYLEQQRRELSGNAFRRQCKREYINMVRHREWIDLVAQLRDIGRDLGWRNGPTTQEPSDQVLVSVLSGLLSHVGLAEVREPAKARRGKSGPGRSGRPGSGPREYLGARGAKFAINPGSALAKNPPELVMAVELVETSRLWARIASPIRAEWIEQVGSHLVKRQYSEPHWSSSSASVVAYEKVLLYGVPIIAERRVNFGRIDPVQARQIFIQSALVEGGWHTRHRFFAENQRVRAEAEQLEERQRRRDLTVDDAAIFEFYDRRVGAEVVSGAHFDSWWKQQPDQHLLDLHLEDLLQGPVHEGASQFPDHWSVRAINGHALDLPVSYVFDPGSGADGVTVELALEQVNQVAPEPFTWQVPGLRLELATELIRSLPKALRTNFVPAPEYAGKALVWLEEHQADTSASFPSELARALVGLSGVRVGADDFTPSAVPDHLQVRFSVHGTGQGTQVTKDFTTLRQDLSHQVTRALNKATKDRRVTGRTSWDFDALPTEVSIAGRTRAHGYPALHDEGATVGTIVAESPRSQQVQHERGVRRLLTLTNPDPTKWVISHLSNTDKIALAASPYPSVPALLADARLKAVDRLARQHADLTQVRDRQAYEGLALQVRQQQADTMAAVVRVAARALQANQQVSQVLAGLPADADITTDLRAQRDNLVFERCISATLDPWYDQLPRYLQAMVLRAQAWQSNPGRDTQQAQVVDQLEAEYAALTDLVPPGPLPEPVETVGFLIEELRVSLFAQRLGTSTSVSAKKIRTAISAARASLG